MLSTAVDEICMYLQCPLCHICPFSPGDPTALYNCYSSALWQHASPPLALTLIMAARPALDDQHHRQLFAQVGAEATLGGERLY